jgi:hypothetical protein
MVLHYSMVMAARENRIEKRREGFLLMNLFFQRKEFVVGGRRPGLQQEGVGRLWGLRVQLGSGRWHGAALAIVAENIVWTFSERSRRYILIYTVDTS